jgi:hypothetical protein
VLREVARRLLASVRNYDYVPLRRGRVPDRAGECSASDLIATAERMGACVSRKPVEPDAGPIHVTLSIGLVAGHPVGALLKGEDFCARLLWRCITLKGMAGTRGARHGHKAGQPGSRRRSPVVIGGTLVVWFWHASAIPTRGTKL